MVQSPRAGIKRFRMDYEGPWSPLSSKCGKKGKQWLLILLLILKKEVLAAAVTEENIAKTAEGAAGT